MLYTHVAKTKSAAIAFQCAADVLSRHSRPVHMPNAWTLVTDADLAEVEREGNFYRTCASIDNFFGALSRTRNRFDLNSYGFGVAGAPTLR
jgi:hypothetical protein